ncbi:MAG: PEP/pyruvate-binding domain-containing protein, partial [Acidimicrobiia bacterium]
MSGPDVFALSDTPDAPFSTVGGKAQSLGRLKRSGFKVPDGFVVTPDAVLDSMDIQAHVRAFRGERWAVRSSGAAEDGANESLAGRYLSILDVDSGSIPTAVGGVRESARVKDDVTIPVLTQVMIDPVCAGVAFTADPITGNRDETIVVGARGVAERLLSGETQGDEWRVAGARAKPVRQPEGVLDSKLVRRVARVAADIAREFDAPQDIEWAWDGKELWVIQARPITRLPDEVSWEPPAPGVYHRSLRFGEWIPEPVTPLFESWLLPRMERRLHDHLYEQIGQVAPEPLHVIVNGWYYYSLNWLPVPGVAFRKNFFNILGRLGKDWRKAAPMFPQTIRFAYKECEDDWRENILPRFHRTVSETARRVENLSPTQLIGLVDELADEVGSYFGSIATVAGSAYKFEAQLAQFWNKHLKEKLGLSHMVLLQGLEIPDVVYRTPRLESLDWSLPPMSPGIGPVDVTELKDRRNRTVGRAEKILAGSPRRLRKFRRLLAEAQHVVTVREEQLSLLSLPWPVMRRAVQRVGETLAAARVLGSPDDIFYLKHSEVGSLLENPEPMNAIITARREDRAQATKLVAPLWVGKVPPIARFLFTYSGKVMGAIRSDGAIVHGVPASPGRVTGRVRVVRDSTQFDEFQDGEILVAPLTAPAWTDLFDRAAAVVTDVGSALAHASII